MRDLRRHDQDLERLRQLLLEGGASPQVREADVAYFSELRQRIESY